MRWLAAAGCLALSAACHGDDWIIGGELPADIDSADDGPAGTELTTDPGACPSSLETLAQRQQAFAAASVDATYAGRWRGQLDDAAPAGFPSRDVELEIDASGAGTLSWGVPQSDRVVAPSDEGYLCREAGASVVCGSASGFVGGFAYPISGAGSRDGVLSFEIVMADPWGSWCAQHEPVSWEDPSQACGLRFGVLPDAAPRFSVAGCTRSTRDGVSVAIDCALMYALEYCQCAPDACFARFDRVVDVGLSSAQEGTLSGSLWYENGANAAWIELSRVP